MQKMSAFSQEVSGGGYTIHNGDVPLFDVQIDPNTRRVKYVTKVHSKSPAQSFPMLFDKEDPDTTMVMNWFNGRNILLSDYGRSKMRELLVRLVGSLDPFTDSSLVMGMQLTDHYWIKPMNSSVEYDRISLFQQDLGSQSQSDFSGFWIGDKEAQWYVRKYIGYTMYNELFTVALSAIIGSGVVEKPLFVDYEVIASNVTRCKNFVSSDQEYIPAIQILWRPGYVDTDNLYKSVVEVGSALTQSDYRRFVDFMLIVDFIVGNIDRDFKNFGFLRQLHTDVLRPAPLYNGAESMLSNVPVLEEWNGQIPSKPFKVVQDYQITLVDSRPFQSNLESALKIVPQLYEKCYSGVLDSQRYDFVLNFVTRNIEHLLMR